jgi:hypothetical protein
MISSVRTCHDRCRDAWKRCRNRTDTRLHAIVLCGHDEPSRMRRRFHIHVCMLSLTGVLAGMAGFSMVDGTVVVGVSAVFNCMQEYLDYVGRF